VHAGLDRKVSGADLSSRGSNSHIAVVRIWSFFSRLPSILAIVGILIAPAALPVNAMTSSFLVPL
jgi:hypothetical protein